MTAFEVTPDQIQQLNADQLVELLRRLIQSECLKNNIFLSSATVPAQITIPDGGEDGRVEWSGAPNQTDYLPSRFTIFQCKKTALSPAKVKKEAWTKKSAKRNGKKDLNDALLNAISKSGAYLLINASAVVSNKRDSLINAIKEGIREAGNEPDYLSKIDIYDSNKLSDWTNTHPAVAIWLNETLGKTSLHGFQSFDMWSGTQDMSKIAFQTDDRKRFLIKGIEASILQAEVSKIEESNDFSELGEIITAFFKEKGKALRIIAPSGYGKTKLVHALIDQDSIKTKDQLNRGQVIYCIFEEVKDRIDSIARDLSTSQSPCLLIVDDCPDDKHKTLSEISNSNVSNLRLVTIGIETNMSGVEKNLVVEIKPASDYLIEQIVTNLPEDKNIESTDIPYIRTLAQGFPRMAIVATEAIQNADPALTSVDSLINKILWDNAQQDELALESLQLLSLFDSVGIEGQYREELDKLAEVTSKSADSIFKHLHYFKNRGVVVRHGDFAEVQPLPLAECLIKRWLDQMPSGSLERLFNNLSDSMKMKMIGRLRWVSWSDQVKDFARCLLTEVLPNAETLNQGFNSQMLDRFVHLAPDETMARLDELIGNMSVDKLLELRAGRRNTVWALEKLVFRKETFDSAARLMMRLAAAENENWGNNATGQFKSLFQLKLSGTEADPKAKMRVLDYGLEYEDGRVRNVCVAALDNMLEAHHFSRSGGSENIGANKPLKDWSPETWGDIYNYYREALSRLENIALDPQHKQQEAALDSIGKHMRSLLQMEPLFDDIYDMVGRLLKVYPDWRQPLEEVSEWLYFDRRRASNDYGEKIRSYYDELLPEDEIGRLIYYMCSGSFSINDPDTQYKEEGTNDHEHAFKQIKSIVAGSPTNAGYFFPAINAFLKDKSFNAEVTAITMITKHVENPIELLEHALSSMNSDTNDGQLAKLIIRIIRGASEKDELTGKKCLKRVLDIKELRPHRICLMEATGLNNDLMERVINMIRDGNIKNGDVNFYSISGLALPDRLKDVDDNKIQKLVNTLIQKGQDESWASIDFLLQYMYKIETPATWEIELIKSAITNPSLFEEGNISYKQLFYHWKELAITLFDKNAVDGDFCAKITKFIISIANPERFGFPISFSENAKEVLKKSIALCPDIVWQHYVETCETADDRLKYILMNDLFLAENPSGSSILNDVPPEIYISWMLENKTKRIGKILEWINLFDENRRWSNVFIDFVNTHIEHGDPLSIIVGRLTLGTFTGSFATRIEEAQAHLKDLQELTSNRHVQKWLSTTIRELSRRIKEERHRDENRQVSFRS